jgi:hypothetical protein
MKYRLYKYACATSCNANCSGSTIPYCKLMVETAHFRATPWFMFPVFKNGESSRLLNVFSDLEGNIFFLDRSLTPSSFKAFQIRVLFLCQLRQHSILVSIGVGCHFSTRQICSRNLIGWRQTLTTSPPNHIHFLNHMREKNSQVENGLRTGRVGSYKWPRSRLVSKTRQSYFSRKMKLVSIR